MPGELTDLLFELTDWLSGELAQVYVAERNRSEAGEDAMRWRMVEAIISGEQPDPRLVARILDHPVERHHVAVILWRDGAGGADAAELLDACGGENLLQVRGHAAAVWAWIGFRERRHRVSWPRLPDGWRAAAGPPVFGLPGLRRSHLAARHAARIIATVPATASVCEYADVRTVCLLASDAERARWFVQETLGTLAAPDPWPAQLRETLRRYLASGRRVKATAEQLGVARGTVTYRVDRAKELLGRTTDLLDIRLALEIMRFPAVIDSSPAARPSPLEGDGPGPLERMYIRA